MGVGGIADSLQLKTLRSHYLHKFHAYRLKAAERNSVIKNSRSRDEKHMERAREVTVNQTMQT